MKRVAIYLDEEDYRKLRAKLILIGITASEWLRRMIKQFVSN